MTAFQEYLQDMIDYDFNHFTLFDARNLMNDWKSLRELYFQEPSDLYYNIGYRFQFRELSRITSAIYGYHNNEYRKVIDEINRHMNHIDYWFKDFTSERLLDLLPLPKDDKYKVNTQDLAFRYLITDPENYRETITKVLTLLDRINPLKDKKMELLYDYLGLENLKKDPRYGKEVFVLREDKEQYYDIVEFNLTKQTFTVETYWFEEWVLSYSEGYERQIDEAKNDPTYHKYVGIIYPEWFI